MLSRALVGVALVLVSPAAFAAPEPKAATSAPPEAKKLEAAFAAVADRVAPSVVTVDVLTQGDGEGRFTRWIAHKAEAALAHGAGSGIVFSADGVILTNNHLIEDALSIQVRLSDGRLLPAKLLGRDPTTDLAALKIDAQGLSPAKLADTDAARAGQWVVAVGAPFGSGTYLSSGVVGAKGKGAVGVASVEDYLQTSLPASALTSGGAVCDLDGRVLGVASDAIGRGTGVGFAIPATLAKKIGAELAKGGRILRPTIGAGLQELTPDLAALMKLDPRAGVLISGVGEGPARKANLKAGDVIASVDKKPVREPADLMREILAHEVGQTIVCEVIREGQRYSTQVTLGPRTDPPLTPVPAQQAGVPQVGLGFNVREISAQESSQRGLPAKPLPMVTVVSPGSSADRAGLRVGDVIVETDGVSDPNLAQLQQASQDGQLLLRVRRRDQSFYAAVRK